MLADRGGSGSGKTDRGGSGSGKTDRGGSDSGKTDRGGSGSGKTDRIPSDITSQGECSSFRDHYTRGIHVATIDREPLQDKWPFKPIFSKAHSAIIKGKVTPTDKVLLLYLTLSCIARIHLTWVSEFMPFPGLWAFGVSATSQDHNIGRSQ